MTDQRSRSSGQALTAPASAPTLCARGSRHFHRSMAGPCRGPAIHGVRVEMPDENVVTPVRAFHVCEVAALREAYDVVLIAVKAYDTRWACELIKPLVRPDGLVVGLQNGMSIDDVAAIVDRGQDARRHDRSDVQHVRTGRRGSANSAERLVVRDRRVELVNPMSQNEVAQCLRHAGTVDICQHPVGENG